MTDDLVKRLNEDFSVNAREDIQHQMKVYETERKEAADRIEQLSNALSKYSCKCTEPCALYKAEKEREGDMPHMMCGWWSVAALNGDK